MGQGTRFGSTREAASLLGWKPQTLRKRRHLGSGPAYYRTGEGLHARVLYDLDEVRAWVEARRFKSTSEESVKLAAKGGER